MADDGRAFAVSEEDRAELVRLVTNLLRTTDRLDAQLSTMASMLNEFSNPRSSAKSEAFKELEVPERQHTSGTFLSIFPKALTEIDHSLSQEENQPLTASATAPLHPPPLTRIEKPQPHASPDLQSDEPPTTTFQRTFPEISPSLPHGEKQLVLPLKKLNPIDLDLEGDSGQLLIPLTEAGSNEDECPTDPSPKIEHWPLPVLDDEHLLLSTVGQSNQEVLHGQLVITPKTQYRHLAPLVHNCGLLTPKLLNGSVPFHFKNERSRSGTEGPGPPTGGSVADKLGRPKTFQLYADREGAKPNSTDDALFVLLVKPGYDKLIQVEASRRDFPNSGGITCEPGSQVASPETYGTLGAIVKSRTRNREVGFLTNRHVAVDLDYPNQKMFQPLPPNLGPAVYLGAVERATSFITDDLRYGIFAGTNPETFVRADGAFIPFAEDFDTTYVTTTVKGVGEIGDVSIIDLQSSVGSLVGRQVIKVGRSSGVTTGTIMAYALEYNDERGICFFTDFLVVGENQQTFDLEGDSGSLILFTRQNGEKPRPAGIIWGGTANRGRLKLKIGQPPENWTSGVDLGRLVDLLELDLITTREGLRAAMQEQINLAAAGANPTVGESSPHAKDKAEENFEPLGLSIQQRPLEVEPVQGAIAAFMDKDGNPPGIIRDEEVDPLPSMFKQIIKRMVWWHILPPSCVPNSCIMNIYDEGDCIPSHSDHHVFLRPFYAALEYVSTGHLYVKSDVYSFSVVLVESRGNEWSFDKCKRQWDPGKYCVALDPDTLEFYLCV